MNVYLLPFQTTELPPKAPLEKNCEIFERFLENKIELIPMFPLI